MLDGTQLVTGHNHRDAWSGLADGTREWVDCFLATARELGFETSVLEPCVLVLRSPHQGYHGIFGVAVDDMAGVGDEVWELAITKLRKRFTFGTLGSGRGEILQSRSHSMRVGQPAHIKSLDSEPFGKLRR